MLNHYFQLFFALLLFGCLVLIALPTDKRLLYDRLIFWVASSFLIAFAVLRPLGIARDDISYITWVWERSCPTLWCGRWIQGERDQAWYSIVGILKSFYPEPRVALWLSGFGLVFRLWVIDKLCAHRSLALLFYYSCFYLVTDITALRLSLSVGIFFLGFYLLVRSHTIKAAGVFLVGGLFHQQAYLSPILLLGCWIARPSSALPLALLFPIALLAIRVYPNDLFVNSLLELPGGKYVIQAVSADVASYFQRKAAGEYDHIRLWPLVALPVLIVAAWLLPDLYKAGRPSLFRYSAASMCLAAWMLWALAAIPGIQIRIWEFFLLPIIFVIGNARLTRFRIIGILAISLIYIIKYSFLNDLLIEQRWLHVKEPIGGAIIASEAGWHNGSSLTFSEGDIVHLTAAPFDGYAFARWLGDCHGDKLACSVDMDADKSVSAEFVAISNLKLNVMGRGQITSVYEKIAQENIICAGECNVEKSNDSTLTLFAESDWGYRFIGWGGACKHDLPGCTIKGSDDAIIIAYFEPEHQYQLDVRSVNGRVISDPQGIYCGSANIDCKDDSFDLTLIAIPDDGYVFNRWIGCFANTHPQCGLILDKSKKVTAEFVNNPAKPKGILNLTHKVRINILGNGRIHGLNETPCVSSSECIRSDLQHGSEVVLTAVPEGGHFFWGWTGACQGREETVCRISVKGSIGVGAVFE